jgi:hypothetical protein
MMFVSGREGFTRYDAGASSSMSGEVDTGSLRKMRPKIEE